MYDGTLATRGPWQALVTFQQLIVLANKHGEVDMTAEAISRRTTVPLEIIQEGLKRLQEPDPESRSPDLEGRRIVPLAEHRDWGWRIVNYEHYNKIRSQEDRREYHRQYYHKRKIVESQLSTTPSTNSTASTPIDVDVDVPVDVKPKATTTAVEPKALPPKNGHAVRFDWSKYTFEGITDEDQRRWQEAYPAIPVPDEIDRAAAWLQANPANRKSNYARFLVNWFSRSQDRAGRSK